MDPIARVNGASSFQTISGRKQLALTAKVCGPSSALRRSSHTEGTKVQKPSSGQSVLSKGPQVPAVTGDARFGAANLGAWQRAPDVQGGRACAPARSWTPRSLLRPARPRTKGGKRDPDMHRTRKCNQWDSGMKAQHWRGRRVRPAASRRVHGGQCGVRDQVHKLLHAEEDNGVRRHRGCTGADKREELQDVDAAASGLPKSLRRCGP